MFQNHGPGVIYHNKYKNEDTNVVFLNLQTGGLGMKSDVLQIGLRCGKKVFNQYVAPSKPIPPAVTRFNGFSNDGRTLYVNGKEVVCSSLTKSVKEMLKFLDSLEGPCVLVAHQADFHVKRLKRIMRICYLYYKFENLIDGSVDTLSKSLLRRIFPNRKEQGQMTLEGLAREFLPFPLLHKHNALYNTFLLEQLVFRYFEYGEIMQSLKAW